MYDHNHTIIISHSSGCSFPFFVHNLKCLRCAEWKQSSENATQSIYIFPFFRFQEILETIFFSSAFFSFLFFRSWSSRCFFQIHRNKEKCPCIIIIYYVASKANSAKDSTTTASGGAVSVKVIAINLVIIPNIRKHSYFPYHHYF